ncbi:MAG: MBL fold metallo-hydrolase [Euryarchaeota archaeon]|nr:MBL fold metallo-hydrolase [Euryarchaeota archaeon]
MRVTFLGVGEAFGSRANTSLLVNGELLLECGPHTLLQLRRLGVELSRVRLVYISHLHGDHFLGIPALLLAAREDGREEPLTMVGPPELRQVAEELLQLSYRRSLEELPYEVEFVEAGESLRLLGYELSFAPTRHSLPALAVSVRRRRKLTYACDGAPTEELVELALHSDLLVAEAYGGGASTHSSPLQAAQLASRAKVKRLALVHLWRGLAREEVERAREVFEDILLPEDLETVEL